MMKTPLSLIAVFCASLLCATDAQQQPPPANAAKSGQQAQPQAEEPNAADKDVENGVISRPKNEPYIDDATGVEFPPELAGFVKTTVVKNANPFYGTTIRYAALDGSCADVYIYSLGQALDSELLKTHFNGVLNVISKLSGAGGPIKSLSYKGQANETLGARGSIKALKASFSFVASAGSAFNSEMLIFAFREKIFKTRISWPSEAKPDAAKFEEEIAKLCESAAEQMPPPELAPAPSPAPDAKPDAAPLQQQPPAGK